jgi:hypothetical protein
MKNLTFVITFSALALLAQDRNVKYQPFVGSGITTAWGSGAHSVVSTAGVAIVVPITAKFFLRPVIATGEVLPLTTLQKFPVAQLGGLVGYRATKRTAVLAGCLETMQFPKIGTIYLPTFVVSTATQIHGRWGIYTPTTFNSKAWGMSVQLGYTF